MVKMLVFTRDMGEMTRLPYAGIIPRIGETVSIKKGNTIYNMIVRKVIYYIGREDKDNVIDIILRPAGVADL